MSFEKVIRNPDNHYKSIVITVAKPLYVGAYDTTLTLNDFQKVFHKFADNATSNILNFNNHIYHHGSLKMLIGDSSQNPNVPNVHQRPHREYHSEKLIESVYEDGMLLMMYDRKKIDQEQFPILSHYHHEYSEKITMIKTGPLVLTLIECDKEGYSVKVNFTIIPDREEFLISNLDHTLKQIKLLLIK